MSLSSAARFTAFGIQKLPSSWIGRFASWSYQAIAGAAAGAAAPVAAGGAAGVGFCALPTPLPAASLSIAVTGGGATAGAVCSAWAGWATAEDGEPNSNREITPVITAVTEMVTR